MLIVHRDVLTKAGRKHRDAFSSLRAWLRVAEDANWTSISDVHGVYPAADGVTVKSGDVVTIFNIRGNNYRLLTRISYRAGVVTIIEFLTHAEYDKGQWSKRQ